jgi:WD40 repeat protein
VGAGPEELAPPGTESPTAAWTDDALFALLDKLRGEGFTVGVGEYLEAQAAAAACHRDGLDGDPHRLRNYLAPVLCTNLEQQQLFHRRFDAWWVDHAGGRQEELQPPPLPPPSLHQSELAAVVRRTRPWKWWAASALGAAAVVAGLIWGPILAGLWRSSAEPTVQAPGPTAAGPSTAPRGTGQGKKVTGLEGPQAEEESQSAATLKVQVVDLAGRPVPGTAARLATGELLALRDHQDEVRSAAFSPDGKRVVTASVDSTTRVWAADGSGKPVVLRGHERSLWSAAFSPDGKRIVTASGDGTARVWAADGFGKPVVLRGHMDWVSSAAFSPDGKRIITASYDKTARMWAADGSGKPVVLRGHEGLVLSAAFSPDGTRVITASNDKTARVWAANGSGKPVVLRHEDMVNSAAFSPDGRRVVTASGDGAARVWAADGSGKPVVLRHEDQVSSAAFSSDGKRVVTASYDKAARVWAADGSGKPVVLRGHQDLVLSAAFSPDGTRVVTASKDGTARIWWADPQIEFAPSILPALATSDERGEIELATEPQALLFTHPDHHSPPPFSLASSAGGGNLLVKLAPLTLWDRLLENHLKVQAGLALLPLFLAGPWLVWRVRRRQQLVLERRTTREEQATAGLSLPEPRHELYRGAGFARTWVELRRRQRFGAGDLDADATVEASVRRLGFFTPVFRARLEVPVYLALIDRVGFRDQRALMVDLLLDRLKASGVDLDRYDFDRDPRRVALRGAAEVHRDLEEMAGLYPNHHLTVFADGSGFADPVTGRLAPWVARLFGAWPRKALLTPVPVCHWGRRELDLAACGFIVLPANETGIERLADTLRDEEGVVARPLGETWQPPYPDLLAARPGRFLERHPPGEKELSDLCEELAFYLGPDGYRWLCSLAVYPELDGYLTLYLGLLLKRLDGRAVLEEATLMALTRLPWLRHGSMPDWLRLRLLQDLSPADELEVREWMRQLLEQRETPGSRFRLDVARPPEPEAGGLRHRLRRWIETGDWRRLIKDWAHDEPREGPLRDQIFVSFLVGKKPTRLQVLAPNTWRRWVWEQGLAALGPKTGAVFLLTTLLSVLGLLLGGQGLELLADSGSLAGQSKVTLIANARPTTQSPPAPETDSTLQRSNDIIHLFKRKNWVALSNLVHPEKGVRFSPYACPKDDDLVFSKEQVKNIGNDKRTYLWGYFDGSGNPMEMTPREYFNRFVYDRDFSVMPEIRVNNDRSLGITPNCAAEYYPGSTRVEFYLKPAIVRGEPGSDWRALRLVFERNGNEWYLTGIIHDERTM